MGPLLKTYPVKNKKTLMTDHTEKKCPKCGQQLRFPKNIGGMLMACPSCGKKFSSDFKFGGIKRKGALQTVFELPNEILSRICRYFSY
jgi:predicted amidophosphoribosyltransferase